MRLRLIRGYMQLCRPANLPTAAADIIAGLAIAGILVPDQIEALGFGGFALVLVSLVGGSKLLYAGGVVLNDVFDAELDKIERPERPIPSGLIPKRHAALFGAVLLLSGIGMVSLSQALSFWIALMLGVAILIYDGLAKQHAFFGPLFMGICRGLNLWMGMYMLGFTEALPYIWIPVVYIFAITSVSRGEVDAGNRKQIILAGILYAIAILGVAFMTGTRGSQFWWAIPFLGIFAAMVYLPLIKAYRSNTAGHVRAAVKGGVLGLVVMDAAWVAGFAGWIPGILVLSLLPLSGYLSKRFAVT